MADPVIADYGLLSDCTSAALVDRFGSVEWWCAPRFDSPSVFGRLLDPGAGHWELRPSGQFTSSRHYVDDTMVLVTTFVAATGTVTVTDALAFAAGARGHEIGERSPGTLIRRIDGIAGRVEMVSEFAPRMEYGLTRPHVSVTDDGIRARGGPVELLVSGPVTWDCSPDRASTSFVVEAGDTVELRLQSQPPSMRRRCTTETRVSTTPSPGGVLGPASTTITTGRTRSWFGEVPWCCWRSPISAQGH